MKRVWPALPDGIAALCMAFMLCVVPLLFHDAFFDINRIKVAAVCRVVPVLAALMAVSLCMPRGGKTHRIVREPSRRLRSPAGACMALFLLACVIACAVNGFEQTMLDGSEGRYCGLVFMLCCGAAFFLIARGRRNDRLLIPVLLSASAIALLGVANAMGIDPLRFYARIKRGQESTYLSTIGHFDFFGTYLVLMFPLAGGQFVFAKTPRMRLLGFACAAAMALGASASRTDSALLGLHLACLALSARSGGDFRRMARALALWAAACFSLPIVFSALRFSPYQPDLSGLPGMLFEWHVCQALGACLLLLAVICLLCARRGCRAPDVGRVSRALFAALALAVLAMLALIVYFSVFDTQTDLGEAASFLRFNDSWGSLRGFAFIRSLRAYADYDIVRKLFGAGMETTLRVLTPYFDDPSMLRTGVFNDPHCQLLQMLLTCGLFGMIAFAAFYLAVFRTLLRRAGDDPLPCGAFAAVFAYGLVMLINVTQPILIATYVSVCALGLSACGARESGGIA